VWPGQCVVIVNAENTITNKTNNTNASNKDTAIYVVHPNVGLRPPSIGIGHLIIQPMEITDGSQSSHFSVTLSASTGIQLYRKNPYSNLDGLVTTNPVYRI
jgi:hypothetical protein